MNLILTKIFKRIAPLVLGLITITVAGQTPDPRLQISSLDKFGAKAAESVDVTIDEPLLKLAATFLSTKRSPDEAKIKELVAGLKGVYVKHFSFENEGEYSESDIESIRSQLRGSSWTRLVGVRSRKGPNVDVFMMYAGTTIKGLAVLAAQPKQLTVVNIVGPIDLEKLMKLEGQFGIPDLGLEKKEDQKAEEKKDN
ncbi:MAG TPA: DUF4252 domain-containing protein [Blastocatellia bacterium]|nr:DUF4252 domain-containing protein [Blastocatellia bacterium]